MIKRMMPTLLVIMLIVIVVLRPGSAATVARAIGGAFAALATAFIDFAARLLGPA